MQKDEDEFRKESRDKLKHALVILSCMEIALDKNKELTVEVKTKLKNRTHAFRIYFRFEISLKQFCAK